MKKTLQTGLATQLANPFIYALCLLVFCVSKIFFKKSNFFVFFKLIFLYHFNVLMLKIILKNKKILF